MRILLTTDTVGGVWTYALELARTLVKYEVEIVLATMGAPLSHQQWEDVKEIPGLEVYESAYKLEWMEDQWEDVRQAGDWLLHLERRLQPDVVHLNGYAHGSLPWQAPVLVVGHSCVLSWWKAVKGEPAPTDWDRYRQEVTAGLRATSLVAAPTQAMLDALHQDYGPFRSSRVIPNGRDPALFPPACKEPFVLTAGRLWDEAKNVAALDEVASAIPWPIYAAGESRHPCGCHVHPRSLQPLGRLSCREISNWLGRASIYALPARYEPFGLSILEAALAGCVLVVGDISSLREVWGDAALYVPPGDPQALRATLCSLVAGPSLRRQLSHQARSRALQFTPDRMAAHYLAAYQWLLSGSKEKEAGEKKR